MKTRRDPTALRKDEDDEGVCCDVVLMIKQVALGLKKPGFDRCKDCLPAVDVLRSSVETSTSFAPLRSYMASSSAIP